jgi:hypothetical protein
MNIFEDYFIDHNLIVRNSDKGGLGVFVSADIDPYTVIEYSPFSGMFKREWKDVPDPMKPIVFAHPKGSNTYVLGLGYLSLYNHADKNNCEWTTTDIGIYIFTLRKIDRDEELYINYGTGYWNGGWNKL